MEEKHADVLADDTVQSSRRTRHTTQAGELKDGPGEDIEECVVENRVYTGPGETVSESEIALIVSNMREVGYSEDSEIRSIGRVT